MILCLSCLRNVKEEIFTILITECLHGKRRDKVWKKWYFVTLIKCDRRGREREAETECELGPLDREDTGPLYLPLFLFLSFHFPF